MYEIRDGNDTIFIKYLVNTHDDLIKRYQRNARVNYMLFTRDSYIAYRMYEQLYACTHAYPFTYSTNTTTLTYAHMCMYYSDQQATDSASLALSNSTVASFAAIATPEIDWFSDDGKLITASLGQARVT
jgi:hypothetical protein